MIQLTVDIFRDYNLKGHNTLALPALADFFCVVEHLEQLREAVAFAQAQALPVTILGCGSNVVLAERLSGLVIQMAIKFRQMLEEDATTVMVKFGAGENWHDVVNYSLDQRWFGLENLALIPGTVGAAPIQNIGAYGVELADFFVELEALSLVTGAVEVLELEACEFAYRDSVFKQRAKNQYVILSVTFKLKKNPSPVLHYPALQSALKTLDSGGKPTPREIASTVCQIRREKLPSPEVSPNAGSFFKNPVVSRQQAQRLVEQFPGLVTYPQPDGRIKLAAAWLIEQAGWKGRFREGVGVHQLQALVLVHDAEYETVNGTMVLQLAADIQADVQQQFGVDLEIEPDLVGF